MNSAVHSRFLPVGTVDTNLTSIPSFQEPLIWSDIHPTFPKNYWQSRHRNYTRFQNEYHGQTLLTMNTDKHFRSSSQPIRTNLKNIFTANHIKLPQKHWVPLTFLPSASWWRSWLSFADATASTIHDSIAHSRRQCHPDVSLSPSLFQIFTSANFLFRRILLSPVCRSD